MLSWVKSSLCLAWARLIMQPQADRVKEGFIGRLPDNFLAMAKALPGTRWTATKL